MTIRTKLKLTFINSNFCNRKLSKLTNFRKNNENKDNNVTYGRGSSDNL